MNRRDFISASFKIFAITTGSLLLKACGGSGGGGYGGNSSGGGNAKPGGNCLANGTAVDIQLVHTPNHTLTVPISDLMAGVDKVYTLADNGSGHTHTVLLTAADFANLRANQGIMEVSSLSVNHTHVVTVNCA